LLLQRCKGGMPTNILRQKMKKHSVWPDWAKFNHLGEIFCHWANFFLWKISPKWFGRNFFKKRPNLPK
jgi:hypothetical protein